MVIKLYLFIFFLISFNSFAQEGVITVLEAPLFSKPDQSSFIVQHIRKGAKIYIHPAEMVKTQYIDIAREQQDNIIHYDDKHSKLYPDKLFPKGETYFPNPKSKFYKTLSKNGSDAYILKEHVFLLYKDMRELDQYVSEKDPTDYRIEEPLPKGYPLRNETGYRGQYIYGMGAPSTDSYPYEQKIKDSGYDYTKELVLVWSRQVKWDLSKRFFFGGLVYFHSGNTQHITKNVTSSESTTKIGIGPYLSYDIWRNNNYAINAYGSITFNFYDRLNIKQSIVTDDFLPQVLSDQKEYKSTHFGSRFGTQVFIRDILSTFDFIFGANISLELPHSYESASEPQYSKYWETSFRKGLSVHQSYFIGIQTDY